MLEECRAIVLRTLRFSEADLVVHALTDKGQKLNFIARSALKSKKRFAGGVLEPSHCIRMSYKRPSGDSEKLLQLNEASIDQDFPGLRTDYQKLDLALYFLKLISAIVKEGDLEQPSIFNMLGHGLKAIETTQDPIALKMHFEAKVLAQQGVLASDQDFKKLLGSPMHLSHELQLGDDEKKRLRSRLALTLNSYVHLE